MLSTNTFVIFISEFCDMCISGSERVSFYVLITAWEEYPILQPFSFPINTTNLTILLSHEPV